MVRLPERTRRGRGSTPARPLVRSPDLRLLASPESTHLPVLRCLLGHYHASLWSGRARNRREPAASPATRRPGNTTASDVYSLGAVLYKILTGRSPHESESGTVQPMDVIAGARDIPPPSRLNPKIPSDVDYILRKALRSEPEERYVSVEAFANDIRAFQDWRPVQARSGDAWYRARKFLRRYRVPVAAVLLLL